MAGKKFALNQWGLTAIEEEFARLYVANQFNGAQAYLAIKPEVAYESACSRSSLLLRKDKVLARIDMVLAEMMRRMDIQAEDVVQELARGATSNIADFFEWDGDGNVTIRPSDEISREAKGAIKSIRHTTKTTVSKDGQEYTERKIEITLISKEKCLELLGRYFAMYIDRKEVTNTKDLVTRMEQAERRLKKGSIELIGDGEDKKSPPG